ncbi:hypothetical protein [Marinicrinis lubricantis]|uniref:Uncharacterized protein n=1 Tax=Marinicrinis lubricantis TaxID=2086470 RepID=A0ABW1INL2_9BACL
MNIFNSLFSEKCPKCNQVLLTDKSNALLSHVVKSCPNGHYVKEFHPAIETYIEHNGGNH